jgi:cephalosporin-C deacetylase
MALAVGGLVPSVAVVMPSVPFLCHYRRATEITDAAPYSEIAHYCRAHRDHIDAAFRTLSYFDGMNFAVRSTARALFSVGLMDEICPPSTVFAAYNHFSGPKDIRVWQFNDHEGGGTYQIVEQVKFLTDLWR